MRAKVDANHREIAMALKDAHGKVLSLAAVGNGCPDLLVKPGGRPAWCRNLAYLNHADLVAIIDRLLAERVVMLEVKDAKRGRLTPHQVRFHQDWPVAVVTCVDEALEAVHG